MIGRPAVGGSGGGRFVNVLEPSSSPPGVVACVCACGRAACVRDSRAPLACERACPRPGRTHARASVRACVNCMRAHTAERERRRPLNTHVRAHLRLRTYVRTYARAPVRSPLPHAVRARAYVRTQFLWAPALPQARRGMTSQAFHPNLFARTYVPRPSPRNALTGDQPGDGVPHATLRRPFVRTCVYVRTYVIYVSVMAYATRTRVSTYARTYVRRPPPHAARARVCKACGLSRCPQFDGDVAVPPP